MIEHSKKVFIRRKSLKNALQEGDAKNFEDDSVAFGSYFEGTVPGRALTFEEEKKYLPHIIGVDPKSSEWVPKTFAFWANISVKVPGTEAGLELETGFKYPNQEEADKGEKSELRMPINIDDYVKYRHALKSPIVGASKDEAYAKAKCDFYLFDVQVQTQLSIQNAAAEKDAYKYYLTEVTGDDDKTRAILRVSSTKFDIDYNLDELSPKEADVKLHDLVKDHAADFMKWAKDKLLMTKAFIQRAIEIGAVRKAEGTEAIIFGDSTLMGNNLNEAALWLLDEKNSGTYVTLRAKVRNVPVARLSEEEAADLAKESSGGKKTETEQNDPEEGKEKAKTTTVPPPPGQKTAVTV